MEAPVTSGASGAPLITLRVTVRAPDLEAFIERYANHIDGDRIFIFTKNPQPVGTRCQFTLQLASGELLITGKGTVTRVQTGTSDRRHPPGMELVFVAVDDRSQTLVDFLLASREADAPPLIRAVANKAAPPPMPPVEIGRGDAGDIETEDASPKPDVAVTSNPAGARVILDGIQHADKTPMTLTGLDPQRIHEVSIVLDGFRLFTRKIRAKPGDKLHALLFPLERVIEVRSTPTGADVVFNGNMLGKTPYTVRRVDRSKDHRLTLRMKGHGPIQRALPSTGPFEVRGDREIVEVTIALEPDASTMAPPPEPATESGESTQVEPTHVEANGAAAHADVGAGDSFDAIPTQQVRADLGGAEPSPNADAPPAQPDPFDVPPPATDSGKLELALSQHASRRQAAPIAVGPAPAFVEKWRDLPPGPPAAGTDRNVPANPFGEISDGAIEYFVEWSLEQSIGQRADQTSSFANVPMALPGATPEPAISTAETSPVSVAAPASPESPPPVRQRAMIPAATFVAGGLLGALVMALFRGPAAPPAPRPAPVAAAPAAPADPEEPAAAATAPAKAAAAPAKPATAAAEKPAAAPAADDPAAEVELSVTTRPPGALISVDGKTVGESPLTFHVPPGKHEVGASKERYESATSSVEAPGAARLTLERPIARLRLTSTPPGAQAMVAGVARGKTPVDIKLPAYESYDVRMELAGTRPWRKSVYLKGPSTAVEAQLPVVRPAQAARPGAGPQARPAPAAKTR